MRVAVGLLILLAGCATQGPPVAQVVELPVSKFIALDPALLVDCPIATGPVSAVFDVAAQRRIALEECNRRWARVRAMQPKVED